MRSATETKLRDLNRQLEAEKVAHAKTRNQLQAEILTVWRLVPTHYINLMGVYPSLRRLLRALGEAADLQDPTRGASTNDSVRNSTMSPTELGVLTHRQHRANVNTINTELDWFTHKVTNLVPGPDTQYHPPDSTCLECGEPVLRNGNGRPREYCSQRCRQKAATKRDKTQKG